MRGSRFNTSVALDKMDNIVDVLSYYALNEMVAGESQVSAEKNPFSLSNFNEMIELSMAASKELFKIQKKAIEKS